MQMRNRRRRSKIKNPALHNLRENPSLEIKTFLTSTAKFLKQSELQNTLSEREAHFPPSTSN